MSYEDDIPQDEGEPTGEGGDAGGGEEEPPKQSMLVQIAEAVVTELNAATLSQSFTAVRAYVPEYDLTELASVAVTVVPRAVAAQAAGRGLMQTDYSVDVAVQARAATDTKRDALMVLAEEIAGYFNCRRLNSLEAMWIKTEPSVVYDADQMRQLGVFTSVLSLTFRIVA